jgi:hypothetical protein
VCYLNNVLNVLLQNPFVFQLFANCCISPSNKRILIYKNLTALNKYCYLMVSHKERQFILYTIMQLRTFSFIFINYVILLLHLIYYYLFLIITTEVNIDFNIISYLQFCLPNVLLRSGSPTNKLYMHLSSIFCTCYITCQFHSSVIQRSNNIC